MSTRGITLDTGALIAFERNRQQIRKVVATALLDGVTITVPTIVVAEWWRGGRHEKQRLAILRAIRIEPLFEHLARVAGAAVGQVSGAGTIDAIVMASAATRADIVYTSDPRDLQRLQEQVPEFSQVRVEEV